jgi:hypothetical protein
MRVRRNERRCGGVVRKTGPSGAAWRGWRLAVGGWRLAAGAFSVRTPECLSLDVVVIDRTEASPST